MDLSRFQEGLRQGCVDLWASTVHWKDSPSPPPAPDYKGAAEATTKSQQVSQYTPYGSQIYSSDPNSPSGYASTINLNPQAQNALDSQLNLSSGLGNLAQQQLPGVAQQYSHPMDLKSVQDISDKAYGAMTSRLDPQWQANQSKFDTQMANQGIPVGSEAYNNANREFQQSKNDAYQQANLGAIGTMPQTYQLASSEYNQPLNMLNAIRSGAQVQNPQFGQQPGTNYLGAAQAGGQYGQGLYNAEVGQQNAMSQGLFGLGGAGLMALALSDRRLKKNIERVGDVNGIPWYRFEYLWGEKSQGVMADEVLEVKPEAVFNIGGYLTVDYEAL